MIHLTGYNVAIAFFAALGGYTYAYAYAVFATVIGQPGFYTYFNLDRKLSPIRLDVSLGKSAHAILYSHK